MLRHSTGYHLTISPYYKFKTISPFPTRHPILFQLKFPQISRKARGAWPKFLHRFRNENDRLKDPRRVRERARLCRRGFDTSVGGEPSTKTWPVVPRPHLDKLARSLARSPSRCQRAQKRTLVSGFGKLPLPNGMNWWSTFLNAFRR